MKIENNIIKKHLQNVYFVSGGAFGGKTTMARLIEQRHGITRYREGDRVAEHITYATKENQPALSLDRSLDWYGFYSQPAESYHRWLADGGREEAEMAIIDLIKLSQNQRVVADVMIPVDILKEIADYHQVVLLLAPVQMKREHFFDREDKEIIRHHILTMPNPEKTLANVLDALTYRGEEEIAEFYASGFKCIMRQPDSTIENTFAEIERHFGLAR